MNCPHAETTTLLWLYGEADEAHALHVASCAECSRVAALHADVQSAVAPAAPALRRASSESAEVVSLPPQPRRAPWAWGAVLLAASVLLFLGTAEPPSGEPAPGETPMPDAVAQLDLPLSDPDQLDLRLDDVDRQILDLSLDLETL